MYLDFEGPVSGDRGSVTRVDGGTFDWLEDQPRQLVIRMSGMFFDGELTLSALHGVWAASFEFRQG